MESLIEALNDESPNVVCLAAEALYHLDEKELAQEALITVLNHPNEFARCHALNVIDCIETTDQ